MAKWHATWDIAGNAAWTAARDNTLDVEQVPSWGIVWDGARDAIWCTTVDIIQEDVQKVAKNGGTLLTNREPTVPLPSLDLPLILLDPPLIYPAFKSIKQTREGIRGRVREP